MGLWKIWYINPPWGKVYRYRFPLAAWAVNECRYRVFVIYIWTVHYWRLAKRFASLKANG